MEQVIGYVNDVMYEEWPMIDGHKMPVARVTLYSCYDNDEKALERIAGKDVVIRKTEAIRIDEIIASNKIVGDSVIFRNIMYSKGEIASEIEELKYREHGNIELNESYLWYNADGDRLLSTDFKQPVMIHFVYYFEDYRFYKQIVTMNNIDSATIQKYNLGEKALAKSFKR
jgi:hypothetical protein